MSVDYVWICDAKGEYVEPQGLPGCTSHQTSMLRGSTATVLAWLATEGRWKNELVRVEQQFLPEGEPYQHFADVTTEVAAEMAAKGGERLDKLRRGDHSESRLQAACDQNEADAVALLGLLDDVTPWLPNHLVTAVRERCEDVKRMVRRARLDDDEYSREARARAQREDMMRMAIGERIAEVEALRVVVSTLSGQPLQAPFKDEAHRQRAEAHAEAVASKWFRMSSAEWRAYAAHVEANREAHEMAVFGRKLAPPPPPKPAAAEAPFTMPARPGAPPPARFAGLREDKLGKAAPAPAALTSFDPNPLAGRKARPKARPATTPRPKAPKAKAAPKRASKGAQKR